MHVWWGGGGGQNGGVIGEKKREGISGEERSTRRVREQRQG